MSRCFFRSRLDTYMLICTHSVMGHVPVGIRAFGGLGFGHRIPATKIIGQSRYSLCFFFNHTSFRVLCPEKVITLRSKFTAPGSGFSGTGILLAEERLILTNENGCYSLWSYWYVPPISNWDWNDISGTLQLLPPAQLLISIVCVILG